MDIYLQITIKSQTDQKNLSKWGGIKIRQMTTFKFIDWIELETTYGYDHDVGNNKTVK